MMDKKSSWSSRDVALVVLGLGAVISLQRCDPDDGCRYVYSTLSDCEAEWGYGACRLEGGKVYSPEQQQCSSSRVGSSGSGGYHGGGSDGSNSSDGKGDRAIGIERGGFGHAGRGGGG